MFCCACSRTLNRASLWLSPRAETVFSCLTSPLVPSESTLRMGGDGRCFRHWRLGIPHVESERGYLWVFEQYGRQRTTQVDCAASGKHGRRSRPICRPSRHAPPDSLPCTMNDKRLACTDLQASARHR